MADNPTRADIEAAAQRLVEQLARADHWLTTGSPAWQAHQAGPDIADAIRDRAAAIRHENGLTEHPPSIPQRDAGGYTR